MSEFEDKLNAILSSPEAMEQISAIASSLGKGQSGGQAGPGEEGQAPQDRREGPPPESGGSDLSGLGDLLGGFDPGMLTKLLPLMQQYQSGNEEKQALLNALKPFLRRESQEKVDKAIRITRLSRVIRASMTLFREDGHV